MGIINTEMKDKVLEAVTIPMYFNNIVFKDMPEYYSDYTADFSVRPVVKCPLHGEDTPSFRYFEDTNSYYCFGCRSGGDIIHFHQEYMDKCMGESVDFGDTVEFLYRRFVEGRDIQIKKVREVPSSEYVSTTIEVMSFNRYYNELEESLQRDRKTSIETKSAIYGLMDEYKKLVDTNTMNAKSAKMELKARLKEIRDKEQQ